VVRACGLNISIPKTNIIQSDLDPIFPLVVVVLCHPFDTLGLWWNAMVMLMRS